MNKGIIVSKNGFTSGAVTYADYKDIGLVELRKSLEKDKEGRLWNLDVSINRIKKIIYKTQIGADGIRIEDKSIIPKLSELELEDIDFLIHPDGSFETFDDLITRMEQDFIKNGSSTEIINFKPGTYIKTSTVTIPIKSIKVDREEIREEIGRKEFRGDDMIEYIMHVLFENRTNLIMADGEIREISS
ncbi:MAG: hypothetical protein ACC609_11555 [Methanobacterium formicicum]